MKEKILAKIEEMLEYIKAHEDDLYEPFGQANALKELREYIKELPEDAPFDALEYNQQSLKEWMEE